MAYTINAATISGNGIVANITIALDEKTNLVCNVPVERPRTEADVLAAIEQRVKAEQVKHDCAPVLAVVKAALDARVGKAQLTTAEVAEAVEKVG